MLIEKNMTIEEIIINAKKNNVQYLLTIATRISDMAKIIDIANNNDCIFASCGVHPSNVENNNIISKKELVKIATSNDKIISFGETGLDYFYNKNKDQHEAQQKSFSHHIEASIELDIPFIVHTREASDDTIKIIKDYYNNNNYNIKGLIHCFTETMEFAKQVLDLGMYISISGIVTFKNAQKLRDIIKYIPLDRLLVETDSPYLTPEPFRGKTNQPSHTYYVAASLAKISPHYLNHHS
ncbi:MAG TPA: TatD family hydrolase, partial [Candidatus Megaira endosymbiont of Hartmannula sinica]|nr:TatD family hydrolase [Candidatus Megaera endosymbiont of Hartmannula sinica]